MRRLDKRRAANILVDAAVSGDAKAAAKHDIHVKTIFNYRERLKTDPELKRIFDEYYADTAKGWHISRVRALRKANERALELLETEKDLDKVTRFIKDTGEVDTVIGALGVGESNVGANKSGEGEASAENAGGSVEGDDAEQYPH